MELKERLRSASRRGMTWISITAGMLAFAFAYGLPATLRATPDQDTTLRALQARVERSAHELERLRGRKLKHPVPVALQSEADFRAYVERELAHQLPDDLAVKESLALQAFGLLPAGYDLKKGIMELYVSQAGAYYDPEADTFYVLKTDLSDAQFDTLLLHELTHAMQDQYFDLGALRENALRNPNEDTRATLAYVYEGEASYIMMFGQLLQGGKRIDDIPLAQQEMIFQNMRNMSREALLANALANQPKTAKGNDVQEAVKALAKVPGYMFWGLQDPYLKGQYCIHRIHAAQGWPGVDSLFKNPPTSTEQVLHPEKLAEPREEPREVAVPDFSKTLDGDWSEVFRNTLGEAGVVNFFDTHNPVAKTQAAAGWGGDSYVVFQSPTQGLLLFWKTIWDTEKEADEFVKALQPVKAQNLCAGQKGTIRLIGRTGASVVLVAGPRTPVHTLFDALRMPAVDPG